MAKDTKPPIKKQDEMPEQLGLFERRKNKPRRRLTEHDYHSIGVFRDVVWIGETLPTNNRVRTLWRCKVCGNEWLTRYDSISSTRGCPECAKETIAAKSRNTTENYHAVAEKKNVIWFGKSVPKNNKGKTKWQCKDCNHVFLRCYSDMTAKKYGCPECAREAVLESRRLTRKDYIGGTIGRAIQWMGDELPRSNREKTLWSCGQHTWLAPYHDVVDSSSGCPKCQYRINGQNTSKQQREIASMLNGEMNIRVGNRRTIDIEIERNGFRIAIEYDSWYWHGHEDTQKYDKEKYRGVMAQGWKLVQICSNMLIPSIEQLEKGIGQAIENGYANITLDDWGVGNTFNRYEHEA